MAPTVPELAQAVLEESESSPLSYKAAAVGRQESLVVHRPHSREGQLLGHGSGVGADRAGDGGVCGEAASSS